jgi:hypothetical protein
MNLHIVGILVLAIFALLVLGIVEKEPGAEDAPETKEEGPADLLLIGNASGKLAKVLVGERAAETISFPAQARPESATKEIINAYDIIILQGNPYSKMYSREALSEHVSGGGSLIVVGDACSKHPEYSNVAGWSWPSGEGIPVPAQLVGEWAGYSDTAQGADLRLTDVTHPIVEGIRIGGAKLDEPSRVFKTLSKGETIIVIDTDEGSVPAVIEGSKGSGKVVYFSYDPGLTPNILLNSLEYLS